MKLCTRLMIGDMYTTSYELFSCDWSLVAVWLQIILVILDGIQNILKVRWHVVT